MTDKSAAARDVRRIEATASRATAQAERLNPLVWNFGPITVGATTVEDAAIKAVELALRRPDRLDRENIIGVGDRFHARVWVDEAFHALDDAILNGLANPTLQAQLERRIHDARYRVETGGRL